MKLSHIFFWQLWSLILPIKLMFYIFRISPLVKICHTHVLALFWFIVTRSVIWAIAPTYQARTIEIPLLEQYNAPSDHMHGYQVEKEAIALARKSWAHCYFNDQIPWDTGPSQSIPWGVKSLKTNNWTTIWLHVLVGSGIVFWDA